MSYGAFVARLLPGLLESRMPAVMKEAWLAAAKEVRERAYAPYSGFLVGAALATPAGRIFTGCNVENLSFGLTMCAERVAVGKAVSEGEQEFEAIVIVADTAEPVSPCGACRQVLAQFHPGLKMILATLDGRIEEWTLAELLPRPSTGILDRQRST